MLNLLSVLLACDSPPSSPPHTTAAPSPAPAGLFHTRVSAFEPSKVEGLPSGAACWGELSGQTIIYDDLTDLWVGVDGEVVKATGLNPIDENLRFFDVKGMDVGLYVPSHGTWLEEQKEGAEKVTIEWKCGA